jgi:hypothetical protein
MSVGLYSKYNKIIIWLGILLIFLPKINLISIGGETAGLRADDFLLAFISLFLIISKNIYAPKSIIEWLFAGLIITWLISNLLNIGIYHRSNILYSFRYIEYFVFFYIGCRYSDKYNITTLIICIVLLNGVVMVGQSFQVIGGFASAGFVDTASERPFGLTGGPWEIGAMLNFAFGIFAFDKFDAQKARIKIYAFYLVTFALILITGSRMALLAHLIILIIYLNKSSANKINLFIKLFVVGGVVFIILSLFSGTVSERSKDTFSIENLESFNAYYKNITVTDNFKEFPDYETLEGSDLSWLMRISKWSYAIKLFTTRPFVWFFGVGSGTWGPALDGGWLRLITETGLFGSIFFVLLFKRAAKINYCVKIVVVALFINMIMIDIHIAYKAMSLVFFIVGYYYKKMLNLQNLPKSLTHI